MTTALYSYTVIKEYVYRQGRPPVEYDFYPDYECQTLKLSVKYLYLYLFVILTLVMY